MNFISRINVADTHFRRKLRYCLSAAISNQNAVSNVVDEWRNSHGLWAPEFVACAFRATMGGRNTKLGVRGGLDFIELAVEAIGRNELVVAPDLRNSSAVHYHYEVRHANG